MAFLEQVDRELERVNDVYLGAGAPYSVSEQSSVEAAIDQVDDAVHDGDAVIWWWSDDNCRAWGTGEPDWTTWTGIIPAGETFESLNYLALCGQWQQGVELALGNLADVLDGIEAGAGETAAALADQAEGMGDTAGDVPPGLEDIFDATPTWVKALGALVAVLVVREAMR